MPICVQGPQSSASVPTMPAAASASAGAALRSATPVAMLNFQNYVVLARSRWRM